MSDASSEVSSWPAWKIALAVGVPVGVVSLGAYYLLSKPDGEPAGAKEAVEEKNAKRTDPEGSAAAPVESSENFVSIDETQTLVKEEPAKVSVVNIIYPHHFYQRGYWRIGYWI